MNKLLENATDIVNNCENPQKSIDKHLSGKGQYPGNEYLSPAWGIIKFPKFITA